MKNRKIAMIKFVLIDGLALPDADRSVVHVLWIYMFFTPSRRTLVLDKVELY